MTRSQRAFNSPSRVSKAIRPGLDHRDGGFAKNGHPSLGLGGEQRLDVGVLGGGEFGRAVDQGDGVALLRIGGETERILDPGVAGADHDDGLVDIFAGIVELVLDLRAVLDRAAHEVRIALGADGQDDVLGLERIRRPQERG